jgi:hypothetical protein
MDGFLRLSAKILAVVGMQTYLKERLLMRVHRTFSRLTQSAAVGPGHDLRTNSIKAPLSLALQSYRATIVSDRLGPEANHVLCSEIHPPRATITAAT